MSIFPFGTGRIHGILGENGAGKSTLMKMLIGLILPDCRPDSPARRRRSRSSIPIEAARLGIAMVHQHFSLVEPLTVWENVALGDIGSLDPGHVRRRVGEISEQYGLEIDPDDRIVDLTAGMRQRVEIIKCLRRDPEILVFDEPTSVLSPAESQFLFAALRRVVDDEGKAVALVSHKLAEVIAASDEITIMRDGKVVDSRPTAGCDPATLARAMVGREVVLRREHAAFGVVDEASRRRPVAHRQPGDQPVLRITAASVTGRDGRVLLDRLDLEVHAGEIVGVAGVEGNGQRTLGDVLSSLSALDRRARRGRRSARWPPVKPEPWRGPASPSSPRTATTAVACSTSASPRTCSSPTPSVSLDIGLMNRAQMHEQAGQLIDQFDIVCSGPRRADVVAQWRQPTAGRAGPRAVARADGCWWPRNRRVASTSARSSTCRRSSVRPPTTASGVLLISTELEEILDLADRIVVISNGRIVGEMRRDDVDLAQLGLMMSGANE